MPPRKLWITLGISLFLWPSPAIAAAGESAAAEDVAQLEPRQRKLQAKFDGRLKAWVDAAIEEDGKDLAARMTELLRQRALRAPRQNQTPAPAKQPVTDAPVTT